MTSCTRLRGNYCCRFHRFILRHPLQLSIANLTVLSQEALARRLPSGLKATLCTQLVCPLRESSSWPVCASHTFTSPGLLNSPPPETMRLPSGLNATLLTSLVCPLRESSSWPVCASHTFTSPGLPSTPLPETMRLPSGLNATLRT